MTMRIRRFTALGCIAAMLLSLVVPMTAFAATTAGVQTGGSFLIADFSDQDTCIAWGQGRVNDFSQSGLRGNFEGGFGRYNTNWQTDSGGDYMKNEAAAFSDLDFSDYKYLEFSFNMAASYHDSTRNNYVSKIKNWVTVVLSTGERAGDYSTYQNNECLTYEIDLSGYTIPDTSDGLDVKVMIPLRDFVTQFDGMRDGVQGETDGVTPLDTIRSISILGSGMGKEEVGGVGNGTAWCFKNSKWADVNGCDFYFKRLALHTGDSIDIRTALDAYMSEFGEVSANITLPVSFDGLNGSITWVSDKPELITDEGVVTQKAKSDTATLTATILGDDGSSDTVSYLITVTGYAGDGVLEYLYNADMSKLPDGAINDETAAALNDLKISGGHLGTAYDVRIENGALIQQAKNNIPSGTQPADTSQIQSSYNMVRDGTRQYYEICYASPLKKEINFAFQAIGGKYNSFLMIGTTPGGAVGVSASPGKGEAAAVKYISPGITANAKVRMRLLLDTKNDEIDGLWFSVNGGEFVKYNPFGSIDEPFGYASYQSSDASNRFNLVRLYASGSGSVDAGQDVLKLYYIRSWTDMSSYFDVAENDINKNLNSIIGDSGVVRDDLELPTAMPDCKGLGIGWSSSNPAVIADDGSVTLPDNNTEVTLTANMSFDDPFYEDLSHAVSYTVTVGGRLDEEYIVANDVFYGSSALNAWEIDSSGGTAEVIDGNIVLEKTKTGKLYLTRKLTANEKFELQGDIVVETALKSEEGIANTSVLDKSGNAAAKIETSDDGIVYTTKNGRSSFTDAGVSSKLAIRTDENTTQIWHNGVSAGDADQNIAEISGISKIETVAESGKTYLAGLKVTMPNAERLPRMQRQLTWDLISDDPMEAVTHVQLFDTAAAGIKIQWESDHEAVIAKDGTLKRPETDTPVTLTARLYKEEDPSQYVEKKFDVIVPARTAGNLAYGKPVTTDLTAKSGAASDITDGSVGTVFRGTPRRKTGTLTVDLEKVMPISSVRLLEDNAAISGFTIDTSADNVTWNTAYTGNTVGESLRAEFEPVLARYVRLNVSAVQSGSAISISEMEIYFDATDQQRVNADAKALTTDASYTVSSDLHLADQGAFGSAITWESSHPDWISNSGKFLGRPNADTVVVMKATLKYGDATASKTFNHLITGSSSGSIGGGASGRPSGGSGGGGASYSPPVTGVTEPTAPSNPSSAPAFLDIDGVPWAAEAINALKSKGILKGDGLGNFEPYRTVTREEFLKMLLLTFEIEIDTAKTENPFADCAEGEWYMPYVTAAYSDGIINGLPDGNFGIGMPITRQDMAVMVYRAAIKYGKALKEGEGKTFSDAEYISAYAKEAIDRLSAAGVFGGDDSGRFHPTDDANRAEAAVVMNHLSK